MTTPTAPTRSPARRAARLASLVLACAAAVSGLQGCVLLVGGAAAGGALVVSDRRTAGAQLEDQSIELKAGGRIRDALPDRGDVSVTSYNRVALITGEVPTEADRDTVVGIVKGVGNVQNVDDELLVGPVAALSTRSSDTIITSRVKAAYVEAKDLQANSIKVVTARGNVYLMGLVTAREADRATELARGIPGVMKVVRVFEILSESELANLQNK